MDLLITFKKYFQNLKYVLLTTILFIFTLFLINPLFSIVGGSLDISYNLFIQNPINIILTLLAIISFIIIFTVLQTILIYRIESTYAFEKYSKKEIKKSFFEILEFNITFYLTIFLLSSFLYDLNLLNNIFTNIIMLIISILFWFVPQIVILEKEKVINAILLNFNYVKRNWLYLIYLFVASFILVLITYIIDCVLGSFGGPVVSTMFFVIVVIPFVEILKTEIYLDKYNLLKPI